MPMRLLSRFPGPFSVPLSCSSSPIPSSHLLSVEIIQSVINFSTDYRTLKNCTLLCHFFLPVARKHLFSTVTIYCRRRHYKLGGFDDPSKSELLYEVLTANPEIASYIKHLEIFDRDPGLGLILAEHRDPIYDSDSEVVVREKKLTERYKESPGSFYHDQYLPLIFDKISNLKSFLLHSSQYQLNWPKYLLKHEAVMNKLIGSSSLNSFKIGGITGFSLALLNRMDRLKTLRLSCFDFVTPSHCLGEDALLSNDVVSSQDSLKTYIEDLNISKLEDQEGLFADYLTDPKSVVRFEGLSSLTVNIKSLDDISITSHLLHLAAFSLERLDLSTKMLYQHIDGYSKVSVSLSSLTSPLLNLHRLRILSLRLNYHSSMSTTELDWFLSTLASFPSPNVLSSLTIIIDMAHNTSGQDRSDLAQYPHWSKWEDIFLDDKFIGLQDLNIVISSVYQEYNYRDVGPRDCIFLPRLEGRGNLKLREMWDNTSSWCLVCSDSFMM